MKKRKIAKAAVAVLSIMAISAGGAALAACGEKHSHSYDGKEWFIVDKPTLDLGGTAGRDCVKGDYQDTMDVPKLNDTSFWTETTKPEDMATHTEDGSRSFENSEFGLSVTITVLAGEHDKDSWEITKDPTLTEPGKAKYTCTADGFVSEEIEIPALSNPIWTKTEDHKDPTHTEDGYDMYHSVYGDVKHVLPKDEEAHSYGEWEFVDDVKPDMENGATIKRVCAEDETHVDTQEVAALSDDSEWDMEVDEPATHQHAGSATYTHKVYEDVVVSGVEIPKEEHTFGAWEFDGDEPTEENGAKIKRVCSEADCAEDDTAVEEENVPALSDEDFWTVTEEPADYNHGSKTTYYNEEYDLTVSFEEDDKIVAPYDNNKYYATELEISENNGKPTFYVRSAAPLTVNEHGVGIGTAFPFRDTYTFEMLDAEKGYVKITAASGGIEYAYVDFETGAMVMTRDGTWDTPYVLLPMDSAPSLYDFSGSACLGQYVINYTNGDTVYDFLITDDGVFFNVKLYNSKNELRTATNCFDIPEAEDYYNYALAVTVNGKVVKGYGFDGTKWVVASSHLGVYEIDGKKVLVNGAGLVAFEVEGEIKYAGEYMVISDDAIGVIVDEVYYELTLNHEDNTCTAAELKVNVSYNFGEYAPVNAEEFVDGEVSKYVPIALVEPEHETMKFMGWYEDADFTIPAVLVDGAYVPAYDVTLYAKWAAKVTITLHNLLPGDEDKATVYFGEGDIFGDKLTLYTKFQIDEATNTYFEGWCLDEGLTQLINMNGTVYATDNGAHLYAKWVAVPKYVGEFQFAATNNASGWNSGYNWTDRYIKISVAGEVTGDITAQFTSYDPNTKELRFSAADGTAYIFFFDEATGVMVTDDSSSGFGTVGANALEPDGILVAVTNVASHSDIKQYGVKVFSTIYYKTRFISYNGHVLMLHTQADESVLILDDTKFVLEDNKGEALTFDDISGSKTLVVKDLEGNVIFAVAANNANFGTGSNTTDLDEHFGKYTLDGGDELFVTGYGELTKGERVGTYTISDSGSYTLNVWFDNQTEYIRITLNKGDMTYTFDKPTVDISYNVGEHGEEIAPELGVNIEVVHALPELVLKEGSDVKFRGWFFDANFEQAVPANWKPAEKADGYVLYAKFDGKATVTFYFNDDDNTEPHGSSVYSDGYVGDALGSNLPAIEFEYEDHQFVGWFTKDGSVDGDWGEQVTANTVISGDAVEFFAKWLVKHSVTLHYNDNGATEDLVVKFYETEYFYVENYNPKNVYVDGKLFVGWYIDEEFTTLYEGLHIYEDIELFAKWEKHGPYNIFNGPASGNSSLKYGFEYDEVKGYYKSTNQGLGSTYSGMAVVAYAAGVLSLQYQVSSEGSDPFYILNSVYAPGTVASGYVRASGANGLKEGDEPNPDGWISYERELAESDILYIFYTKDSSVNTGADTAWVRNLQFFAFDASLEGDYHGAGDDIHLDGKKTITQGSKSGTYAARDDGKYDVYFTEGGKNVEHYLLELDGENYTLTEVKTVLRYDLGGHGTKEDDNVFTGVEFTLPGSDVIKADGYAFRGWYLNAEFSGSPVTTVTPVDGEEYTFYAKWAEALTLTMVVGNELENMTAAYPEGDMVDLTSVTPDVLYANGKHFAGWYFDEEFANPATSFEMSANTLTVYAKWEDGAFVVTPQVGNYGFVYDYDNGFYKSNNQHKASSQATMTIEIFDDGVLTFSYQAFSESNEKWDYMHIHVNGEKVANAGGTTATVTDGVPQSWLTFERVVKAGDIITIIYEKDGTTDKDPDTAWVKDIQFVQGGEIVESIFSGKSFAQKGSTGRKIVFDEGSAISAKLDTYGLTITFGKGSYDEDSKKLTLTVTGQSGNYVAVNDTLVFEYDEAAGTLKFLLSESTIHPTGSLDLGEDYGFTEGKIFDLE